MNLSELFIERPITTTLLMSGIVVFGAMVYQQLPVSDLPVIDFPTIQVGASLPGANPQTVASSIALPLEKNFANIAGLNAINSTSTIGSTSITLQFDLNRNIDAAAQDVQSMIAKTQRLLPPQMPAPPSFQKVNPNDQPVVLLALRSAILPISTVDEYAETTIAQRISMVSGVAQVGVFGQAKYAVRIDVDPRKLAAHGIGLDEVAAAVQGANDNTPTGTMFGADRTLTMLTNSQLMKAAAFTPMIVAYRSGHPVRLDEVAHVYDGVEGAMNANWYQGQDRSKPLERAVALAVFKQPNVNVVQVANDVMKLLPTFREQLPPTMHLDVRADRSVGIRDSVADVKFTLLLTIGLVIAVIFLFLRNASATVIPSLALPGSIVATFAVMYLLDYSLDNLSLMALTLSVGFVVDDAIVMLENIVRHMEMGKNPLRAALDGSREISFTIVSMTVSLAAVFIPILFMGGIVGRLLHEFAVTIGVAVLVSGLISISLTPMLCSRFLQPPHSQGHSRFYNATERLFQRWLRGYDRTLQLALQYRALMMAASVALLVGTVYLFRVIPTGFLPIEDQGRIQINVEAAQGIGFDEMSTHMKEVAEIVGPRSRRAGVHDECRVDDRREHAERPPQRRPDAARRARAIGPADCRGSQAGAGAGRGRPRLSADSPADQHWRPVRGAQPLSVHPAGHGSGRAVPHGADVRGEAAADAGAHRRQQRPAAEESAGEHRHRPPGARDARLDGESGRLGPVQRLRHAVGVADQRAQQRVQRDPAGRPEVSAGSRVRCRRSTCVPRRTARSCRSTRCASVSDRYRPVEREPHGSAAVGHDLVQLAGRLLAR